jgi:hypothetical protein
LFFFPGKKETLLNLSPSVFVFSTTRRWGLEIVESGEGRQSRKEAEK